MSSLWIVFSTFCTACAYACIKDMPIDLSFGEILFIRSLCVLIVAFFLVRSRNIDLHTNVPCLQAGRCFFGIASLSINIIVVRQLFLSTAQTLQYTSPLFLALWAIGLGYFYKREISWKLIAAICAGFAGILIILRPVFDAELTSYALLGLLSGACGAGSGLCMRRLGVLKEPEPRTVFWFALSCTVAGLAFSLIFGSGIRLETFSLPVLYAVGLFTALAQVTQTIAWARGKTLLCGVLQFSAIVFATLIGWVFFDEFIDLQVIGGMALIVAASGYSVLREKMLSNRRPGRESGAKP